MSAGDFTQSLQVRHNAGQASIYNPRLGKFTQPDTIIPGAANPQAFNRYAYVINNPVNFVDPTGHCAGPMMDGERCFQGQGDIANQRVYGNSSDRSKAENPGAAEPAEGDLDEGPSSTRGGPEFCKIFWWHQHCEGNSYSTQLNYAALGPGFDISGLQSGYTPPPGSASGARYPLVFGRPTTTNISRLEAIILGLFWLRAATIKPEDVKPNIVIETSYKLVKPIFIDATEGVFIQEMAIHNFTGSDFVYSIDISSETNSLSIGPNYSNIQNIHLDQEFSYPVTIEFFTHNGFVTIANFDVPGIITFLPQGP